MLRRQGTRHPPLRQERVRHLLPARLQPPPRRRRPTMGLLQPAQLALGARVLRRQTSRRQRPPRRPPRPRQPLARALALPPEERRLRRDHPRQQPKPDPATAPEGSLNGWELTEGVSLEVLQGLRPREGERRDRPDDEE